jgi:hypothetical protein
MCMKFLYKGRILSLVFESRVLRIIFRSKTEKVTVSLRKLHNENYVIYTPQKIREDEMYLCIYWQEHNVILEYNIRAYSVLMSFIWISGWRATISLHIINLLVFCNRAAARLLWGGKWIIKQYCDVHTME